MVSFTISSDRSDRVTLTVVSPFLIITGIVIPKTGVSLTDIVEV
jgi:hypothetical protein